MLSEVNDYAVARIVKWIRACETELQLRQLWKEELGDNFKMLPEVLAATNKRKEMLCKPKKQEKP